MLFRSQEGILETDDFYAPVRAIAQDKGETVATFSVGIVPGIPERSLEELVELADKALYQAKKQRNRLCVARIGTSAEEVIDYSSYVEEIRAQEA